jgi:hypothetical protein
MSVHPRPITRNCQNRKINLKISKYKLHIVAETFRANLQKRASKFTERIGNLGDPKSGSAVLARLGGAEIHQTCKRALVIMLTRSKATR